MLHTLKTNKAYQIDINPNHKHEDKYFVVSIDGTDEYKWKSSPKKEFHFVLAKDLSPLCHSDWEKDFNDL